MGEWGGGMMRTFICRIFHTKHWKIHHVRIGKSYYASAVCDKCYSFHEVKLGKDILEKL